MKRFFLVILSFFVLAIILSAVAAVFLVGGSIKTGEKIALVEVSGPIVASRGIVDEIKEYREDDSIRAIVLRVNSPGGAVAPSQEIYEEVKRAAASKSVVVSMGSLAASGGYYISAPATRIIANPGTLTGSIGVIIEIPNVEGLMKKVGLGTTVIKSGRHKDMASMYRAMNDDDRTVFQGIIDDVFDQFVMDVASARKMDVDVVRRLSDGRVYTGRQALELGLVDQIGGLEEAVKAAAELAGIKGEPRIVEREEEFSLLSMLDSKFNSATGELFPSISVKYILSP